MKEKTPKLTKRTVFIYKSQKADQYNSTDPTATSIIIIATQTVSA